MFVAALASGINIDLRQQQTFNRLKPVIEFKF